MLSPEEIGKASDDQLPALLAQLVAEQARIAGMLGLVAARLSDRKPKGNDQLLDIHEAASRLSVTKDWLRRRPSLPIVVRLSDGTVRYSAKALEEFIVKHRA